MREAMSSDQQDICLAPKTTIEVECETKRATLDLRVQNRVVLIAQYLSSEEETELLSLDKNIDVFI
jgi:hypothetical protein